MGVLLVQFAWGAQGGYVTEKGVFLALTGYIAIHLVTQWAVALAAV
jgi:hypothetical protein